MCGGVTPRVSIRRGIELVQAIPGAEVILNPPVRLGVAGSGADLHAADRIDVARRICSSTIMLPVTALPAVAAVTAMSDVRTAAESHHDEEQAGKE